MAGDEDTLLGMGFDSARVKCSPILRISLTFTQLMSAAVLDLVCSR